VIHFSLSVKNRIYVADVANIRLKVHVTQKTKNSLIEPPFGDRRSSKKNFAETTGISCSRQKP